MKNSVGELSLTVITIILVITVMVLWGILKGPLQNWTSDTLNKVQENVNRQIE